MKNTMFIENKKRRIVSTAVLIMAIFCIVTAIMPICFNAVKNLNLNGNVEEKTVVLKHWEYDDSITVLTDSEGRRYNVVCDKNNTIKWDSYAGKEITLVISEKTFGKVNSWVLGIKDSDKVLIDHLETLEKLRAENKEMITVSLVVLGVLAAVTCALIILKINMQKAKEVPLIDGSADYIALSQPNSPERKKIIPYLIVWIAVITALCIVIPILGEQEEKHRVAMIVLASILVAVTVAGMIFVFWFRYRSFPKKDREFYVENMPFDLSDISYLSLRKSVKEQLQKELNKEREERPHSYNDFGNGFDVTFVKDGVILKTPEELFEEETEKDLQANAVSASEIFEGLTENSEKETTKGFFLPYERLNFEAVAHYRKLDHPMTVIIKSRLQNNDGLPEYFENDLHLVFDVNLQKTLETFGAEAENLDFLLENKARLMEENCKKKKASEPK